jgi:hypothetical protein
MPMRLALVILAWAVIASSPATSARLLGDGTISCETWTEERDANSPRSSMMLVWVLGFMSAANATLFVRGDPDFLADADIDIRTIAASVDSYCQAHPDRRIADAAGDLVIELLKKARN